MKELLKELEAEVDKCACLSHGRNFLKQVAKFGKSKKSSDKNKLRQLRAILPEYMKYLRANHIVGMDDASVCKRVSALNSYYGYIHGAGYDKLLTAQSKFRPTILEEFMVLLFRDVVRKFCDDHPDGPLKLGAVDAYANLYFYSKDLVSFARQPTIGLNSKNQDFAIYRDVNISVDGLKPQPASLPIVAVECKTYIDKNMLESSVATAEKIKSGNPRSLFCMVAECYDVNVDVDPAYSRIDQIFVLRKCKRKQMDEHWRDVDVEVVRDFVNFVKNHLQRPWSDVAKNLAMSGRII